MPNDLIKAPPWGRSLHGSNIEPSQYWVKRPIGPMWEYRNRAIGTWTLYEYRVNAWHWVAEGRLDRAGRPFTATTISKSRPPGIIVSRPAERSRQLDLTNNAGRNRQGLTAADYET